MRERERSAEILKTQEEELRLEIERLRSQLRGAEKDRNLLMVEKTLFYLLLYIFLKFSLRY